MYRIILLCAGVTAAPALAAPNVVTDIAPVHSLVAMVMGDLGTPELLLPNGADPHDFQLRPSQARALDGADLVVWIGAQISPWLDRAYAGIGTKAPMLTLLDAPGTKVLNFAEEAEDDHGADHGDGDHTDGDHDHSGVNPHAWLDPQNAAMWLPLIAAELSRLDPQNAAAYNANATAGQAAIAATDAQIELQLAPVAGRPFVTFHDAYGYFTAHYGLMAAGSVRMGDAAAPGAAHLSALQQGLRQGDAVCLFPEVNHNPAQAALMTEGTSTRLGGALDPAGVSLPPGPALYGQVLQTLTEALVDCLAAP